MQLDFRFFKQFVFNAASIDTDAVFASTVLGALYADVSQVPEWETVKLDSQVGERILEGLMPEDRAGVSRLLRSLSTS